ncbi:uncharacterized protein LOC127865888 [Dreissena polymorpha]|uniref:Uncharacterized protein n=1 Tax=Dreissena polymorpha TaxID=45954 RepID=A0A9D4LLS8_DREPO|nr:uncharacterized protein LOC127865888 [Dreissena polymorpha]XP_052261896.1 uncharacterized protein LOC127865888 [Dreissena polymorpha]KAH3861125.1 hypothetical protein DPMN_024053 [Dreissena polymorpha]
MGKDKKNKHSIQDIGSFKTKDSLKEEDVQLTKQVQDLERRYRELYKSVQQLSYTYDTCRDHFALQRYGDLKDMIKACITDEVMENAAKYSPANAQPETGKAADLLRAAKRLSESASARQEVDGLHKAEIVKDLEEKKKKKDKMELKFLRLHNRLVKLKRDYEDSKQHLPAKRYGVMKEMIKPLIRDETIKVDTL